MEPGGSVVFGIPVKVFGVCFCFVLLCFFVGFVFLFKAAGGCFWFLLVYRF